MDPVWLLVALVFGLAVRRLGLPPLVGFLGAGFALHAFGEQGGPILEGAAHYGVLLLLFTIGLKLRPSIFLSPAVWGGGILHMLLITVFSAMILGLFSAGLLGSVDWQTASLLAFALSFSSTVLAVKTYEERGEMRARHALIAIGILIIQDILAVGFLLVAEGAWPSVWAFGLLLLPLFRPLLQRLLVLMGHGEMLVLYGLTLTVAGAALFDLVGVKDDLGALLFGVLLSQHPKSVELSRALLGFKDFFLIGFFLSIGLFGFPAASDLLYVALLVALVLPVKAVAYFLLITRFKIRARTAFLSTLGLATFSEFGLIVVNEGVVVGWLDERWLVIIAIAAATSFVVASILNNKAHELYRRLEHLLCSFQTPEPLPEDLPPDIGKAQVLIVGMGRVGRGAYRAMADSYPGLVCGVDVDAKSVSDLQRQNYNMIVGDAEDIDLWRHVTDSDLEIVLLSLPTHRDAMLAARWLKAVNYKGYVGAVAKYEEDRRELLDAGIDAAFNYYSEVGTGFADHVQQELIQSESG